MTAFRSLAVGLAAVLSVSIGRAQGLPAPPQGSGHALLVGQVVEAGSTRPVAGAVVTLGGAPTVSPSNVVFSFSQTAVPGGNRLALTDAQGHFVFTELPAGTYSLQATKPGYSPGGYGKHRATGPPQTIAVGADDRVGDLTIPIWKFATLTGTVTDEANEPVVGVQVRALRRVYDNGRPQFTTALSGMAASTDDRGSYRLDSLIPGEYVLAIVSTQTTVPLSTAETHRNSSFADVSRLLGSSDALSSFGSLIEGIRVGDHLFQPSLASRVPPAADGKVFVYPTTFHPADPSLPAATLISLRAGDDRLGVDIQLKPVPTSRVSGTLTGPSGPLANVVLTLSAAAPTFATDRIADTADAITDARGRFVILGVPPGQYVLRGVQVPQRAETGSGYQTVVQTGSSTIFMGSGTERPPQELPTGQTHWAAVPVTVDKSDVANVAVTMQAGFRIGGRVEFQGAATRPAPALVSRLTVSIVPLDGRLGLTMGRAAIDASGRLSSYELPPGKYALRVQGLLPGWTFQSAMFNGTDISDAPLDLRGPDVTDVVLTFTDRPSSLAGSVRSTAGAPDTSALVLAFPVEAAAPDFTGGLRRMRSARVSRTGSYQLSALTPGDYFVVAVADDAAAEFPSLAFVRTLVRRAARVAIADAESRTQDLITVPVR